LNLGPGGRTYWNPGAVVVISHFMYAIFIGICISIPKLPTKVEEATHLIT
jgi:hypothetical protein